MNSQERDTKDLPNNLKPSIYDEKICSSNHQEELPDRSSNGNNTNVHKNKKSRAAKRYNNDLNSTDSNFNDKRMLSSADNNTNQQQRKTNYDIKDFGPSLPSHDDNSKLNSGNKRVSSEERHVTTCPATDDDQHTPAIKTDVLTATTTSKGKNKKKKNRMENKDLTTKSRFTIAKDLTDEKDETSSTTTESSTGDLEEKNCPREQSNNSNPSLETTKTKSKKSKSVEKHSPILEDIGCADDDFELTTKSKAHKKIKVNPKDTYGGNILKPSTLELPYNLESKKSPERKEFPVEPVIKVKKSTRQNKGKAKIGYTASSEDDNISTIRSVETDSYVKCKDPWDTPAHVAPIGDLSDLASQTENFALQHSRSYTSSPIQAPLNTSSYYPSAELSPSLLSISPSTSAVCNRSSSYSSVVSNNNNTDNTNSTAMLTGQLSSIRKPNKLCTSPITTVENNKWTEFNPFGDHGLPGAFATRCSQQSTYSPPTVTSSNFYDIFSLPPIQERRIPSPIVENSMGLENQHPHQFTDAFSSNNLMKTPTPVNHDFCNHDFLRLRAERHRRRQFEYKVNNSESWPTYPIQSTPVSETLWDYPTPVTSPMWTTPSTDMPTSSFENLTSTSNYDPFNSMAHIWGPPRSSTAGSTYGWNFPQNHLKDK